MENIRRHKMKTLLASMSRLRLDFALVFSRCSKLPDFTIHHAYGDHLRPKEVAAAATSTLTFQLQQLEARVSPVTFLPVIYVIFLRIKIVAYICVHKNAREYNSASQI